MIPIFWPRSKPLFFFLLLAVLLIACGSDGDEVPASADSVADGAPSATAVDSETADSPSVAASDSEPGEMTFTTVTDGEEGVDLPPTPNAAELAATQAALLPPQEPVDACALLSEEEAAAFLSAEITSVEKDENTHTGECKYIAQTVTDRLYLKIAWTPNFGAGDYEFLKSAGAAPREECTDIGDEYYIRSETDGVYLYVVRGEQYLRLSVASAFHEPDEPLKELARRLLAAIPSGG